MTAHRPGPCSSASARADTVVVVAGGDPLHPALLPPSADLVVAADSGADVALALGLAVDVVVGDLDSVAPETLAALRAQGVDVERHHPDKDATDLELALARAVAEDPRRITVVGGTGGRLDHALAAPGALAAVAAPGRRVEAWMGPALVTATVDAVEVDVRPGEQVSLLAWGGPADGVLTDGLRWALSDEALSAGSTRGLSNEATGSRVRVSVASGTVLVIRPHALEPSADRRRAVPDRPGVRR